LPGVDFQAVRAKVSISDVLGLVGFTPCQTRGDQLRGPCPIHGSTSPGSRIFSVHLARNAFRCFKCGSSGNQLDLWAAVRKTTLHAATIDLCRRLQIDIPWIDQE
jgi:DNA primase